MKKITLFAIAALSFALLSCSKEPIQPEQENDRTFSMTLSASVNDVKATMSDAWQFAFTTGDIISLTNNKATGTYYELTRGDDGNFTGEVTAPEEAATWYAYYPSHSVSLAGQTGTKDGTAAYFALAGKQENVPARSRNLNMTLNFQTAILVIENTIKGKSIDINVKTVDDGKWVSGFAAKPNSDAFDVVTSESKVNMLTIDKPGTYYLVVPAGVKIAVYDGDHPLVTTKSATGLSHGKYYTVNIQPPLGALPGVFSVSPTKKVFFSKGNLWADASNSDNPVLHFEEKQYDFETSYHTDHVSHFMWTSSLISSVGSARPQLQDQNHLFCDEPHKQSVDNSEKIYYELSFQELGYLLCYEHSETSTIMPGNFFNTTRQGRYKYGVTVCGKVNCLILLPDYWDESIITLDNFASKIEYNDDDSATPKWSDMEKAGAVCLPAIGRRNEDKMRAENKLYYSTSTLYGYSGALEENLCIIMQRQSGDLTFTYDSPVENCHSLRLVADCW